LVPFRYVTVGTPEGKEEEVESRVREWNAEDKRVKDDRKKREKSMNDMTGSTLEDLSTRESEMSIHESSFMVMQR